MAERTDKTPTVFSLPELRILSFAGAIIFSSEKKKCTKRGDNKKFLVLQFLKLYKRYCANTPRY